MCVNLIIWLDVGAGSLSFSPSLMPPSPLADDWYEQLYPLVMSLKESMGEVVSRAKQCLTFVLLQELAYSLPQCLMLTLRRDIVFSQAVGALMVPTAGGRELWYHSGRDCGYVAGFCFFQLGSPFL